MSRKLILSLALGTLVATALLSGSANAMGGHGGNGHNIPNSHPIRIRTRIRTRTRIGTRIGTPKSTSGLFTSVAMCVPLASPRRWPRVSAPA